jgi:hypothetical protein
MEKRNGCSLSLLPPLPLSLSSHSTNLGKRARERGPRRKTVALPLEEGKKEGAKRDERASRKWHVEAMRWK